MTGYYLLDHRSKPANWYPTRRSPLRLIVVHITAGLEDLDGPDASAEQTARYAATTDRAVSWHSGSDSDSFLRLLPAGYTAFHVQGYNSSSYGHEISKASTKWAGMSKAWTDRTLANTAAALAPIVRDYRIPLRRLSKAQVDGGQSGFAAHADLDPSRRSDPGKDFSWDRLFALIDQINTPTSEEDEMTPQDWTRMEKLVDDRIRLLLRGENSDGKPTGHDNLRDLAERLGRIEQALGSGQ